MAGHDPWRHRRYGIPPALRIDIARRSPETVMQGWTNCAWARKRRCSGSWSAERAMNQTQHSTRKRGAVTAAAGARKSDRVAQAGARDAGQHSWYVEEPIHEDPIGTMPRTSARAQRNARWRRWRRMRRRRGPSHALGTAALHTDHQGETQRCKAAGSVEGGWGQTVVRSAMPRR